MKSLLVNVFSDGSNTDIDLTKILGTIAFCAFLILSAYNYGFKGSQFNPMEWATAVGIIIGAVGSISKIKDLSGQGTRNEESIRKTP